MSIELDLDALADTERRLRKLHVEFTGVEQFDEGLPAAADHDRLGGALSDFGSAWNRRREDLAERILTTAETALAIHDTFVELDEGLAKAAQGKE